MPNRRLSSFQPKVSVFLETRKHIVKTVDNDHELRRALRLRYKVFHREFMGKVFPFGLDTEELDSSGDILAIFEKPHNRIVGTYRLICSSYSDEFYSTSEFELGEFLSRPGVKLELSRACIGRRYRTGAAISLLWRGIAEYIKATKADYLFGCSSIQETDPQCVRDVMAYLGKEGHLQLEGKGIQPHDSYRMENLPSHATDTSDEVGLLVPPLLRSYIRVGAKIRSLPALDQKFRCVDFLTILDLSKMSAVHRKKYGV